MDTLMKVAEDGARMIGQNFSDPDADWAPVLFMRNRDGEVKVTCVPILSDKEASAQTIENFLRQEQATEAVLLTSAWVSDWNALDGTRRGERREALVFTGAKTNSPVTGKMIPIDRKPGYPPVLGVSENCDEQQFKGLFADALKWGVYRRKLR